MAMVHMSQSDFSGGSPVPEGKSGFCLQGRASREGGFESL